MAGSELAALLASKMKYSRACAVGADDDAAAAGRTSTSAPRYKSPAQRQPEPKRRKSPPRCGSGIERVPPRRCGEKKKAEAAAVSVGVDTKRFVCRRRRV